VSDFVTRHITSVEQIELLLLFASDPGKSWTSGQLVREMRSSREFVDQRVIQLLAEGLVADEGIWHQAKIEQPVMQLAVRFHNASNTHQVVNASNDFRSKIIAR